MTKAAKGARNTFTEKLKGALGRKKKDKPIVTDTATVMSPQHLDKLVQEVQAGLPKKEGNTSFTEGGSRAEPGRVPTEAELDRMGQAFGGVLLPSLPRLPKIVDRHQGPFGEITY